MSSAHPATAGLALSLAALLPCGAHADPVQDEQPRPGEMYREAMERTRAGRYPDALRSARSESVDVMRFRALVWVRHSAGDLRGALADGLAGLEAFPEDPFLLDQSAYIAISLRDARLAAELCGRLERAVPEAELDAAAREHYAGRASRLGGEARALLELVERQRAAVSRARWTVAAGAGLMLLVLGALALTRTPKLPVRPAA